MSNPIVEVFDAIENTALNLSVPVLIEDLTLVHRLAGEVKDALAGKHPSLHHIFDVLFKMV